VSKDLSEKSYNIKESTSEFNFKENRFNASSSTNTSEQPSEGAKQQAKEIYA